MPTPLNPDPPRLRRLAHPGGWAWVLDRAPLDTLRAELERFAANTGASAVLVIHGEVELPTDLPSLFSDDVALSVIADLVQPTPFGPALAQPPPLPSQNWTLHSLIVDALGVDPTVQRSDADLAELVRYVLAELAEARAR